MNIANNSQGNTPDAAMDTRIGRCMYFVIYDTQTGGAEFIPNPNKAALEGAGPASVQLVASKGVEKVISGEFGAKVKAIFDSLKLQIVILNNPNTTIAQIIEKFTAQKN